MSGFLPRPVLTIDIVGFSLMSNDEQMNAIKSLIQLLNQSIPQEHNNDEARIWSPSGDGGSITFLKDIKAALTTAINLGKNIRDHAFQLRIGLHSGTVTKEVDFDNRENIWGQGINISARVMSLAKPGQILASKNYVELADLDKRKPPDVTSIGKWWAKHHKSIELYNIYIEGAGIPPSEVDEWFGPFHYPLQQVIETYEIMLDEQANTGPGFRIAVLAKRLLDLAPNHIEAKKMLSSISLDRNKPKGREPHVFYNEFFSPLSPSSIHYFFQNAEFKAFKKDQLITKEGDPSDSMMMVVSGKLSLLIQIKQDLIIRARMGQPANLGVKFDEFGEGEILGEMGLFSPGGKRTATLQANKNTITLILDYKFLELSDTTNSAEVYENIKEIREQIWKLYWKRMIHNRILSHKLFQNLTETQREELAKKGEMQPSQFGQSTQMNIEDIWNYWTIVVSGKLTAKTDSNSIIIEPGGCIGPISLVRDHNPFTDIEIAPNTHLVRIPFSVINNFIKSEKSSRFRNDCYAIAGETEAKYFDVRMDFNGNEK